MSSSHSTKVLITSLNAESFRELARPLTLSFIENRTGEPCSLLLLGDNGTGKSAIVDALEFALQARIKRGTANIGRAIKSQFSQGVPKAVVALSNGDNVVRELVASDDERFLLNSKPHSSFRVSPFVLRRSDIVSFFNQRSSERQKVFWDFFRHIDEDILDNTVNDDELNAMLQERSRLKLARRASIDRLATLLGVDSAQIPLNVTQFASYIKGMLETLKRIALKSEKRPVHLKILARHWPSSGQTEQT